jgi:hypothetical protein
MGLPSDWYIDKGEANQAIASQQQFGQEAMKLLLELMKKKPKEEKVHQGEHIPPNPVANPALPAEPGEIIDAQVLYENPELPASEIPVLAAAVVTEPMIALPSFTHRPEQIAADTAQMLVNELGTDGVYDAEGYSIRRDDYGSQVPVAVGGATMQMEQTLYRVWDDDQNEILVFRDAGPGQGYDLLKNALLPDDTDALLKARYNIEREGLDQIMGDPTFNKQIGSLGDLAPIGSQAANFAHYVLDGYEANTIKTPKYEISRDPEGNITIAENPSTAQKIANKVMGKPAYTPGTDGAPATAETIHNPSGKVLLRTEEGRVATFNMAAKDHQAFGRLFSTSMDKPLNQVVAPPTRSAKPQIARD